MPVTSRSLLLGLRSPWKYIHPLGNSVGEYFDYDTCSTLVDTSRNGILNMMLSDSAENTAQTIQADIDANRPQS